MIEPLHSLLVRELTILSKNFGQASTTLWEISRALRNEQKLRDDSECDKDGTHKGVGMVAAPPLIREESAYQKSFEGIE